MSEVLFLDRSDSSEKMKVTLKSFQNIITHYINDPKSVDFILPMLFTKYGSFSEQNIDDFLELVQFYNENK